MAATQIVDILIIGAGPSGTVAASIAHQQGMKVKVLEKNQFPRFVIGESLIPRCMEHFEAAGFIPALSAAGFEKKHGAQFLKGDKSCLFDFSENFTDGWTWTWQAPRAEFDKILADEVIKMGVDLEYRSTVTGIEFQGTDSLTSYTDNKGLEQKVAAKFIIDASGFGRVIPRILNLSRPTTLAPRKSIFTHVKDEQRPAGKAGTLITFVIQSTDVWIWIIPFSNGTTSLGFVGPVDYFDDFSEGSPEEQLRKLMATDDVIKERFTNTEFLFDPKSIQAFSTACEKIHGPGFAITGNSAEFLDPVFSSGVSFATESGHIAAKLASQQIKGEPVNWELDYEKHILAGVDAFRTYVKTWYDGSLQNIFFNASHNVEIKKQICSVLAGYVWDKSNPYVRQHARAIKALASVVSIPK